MYRKAANMTCPAFDVASVTADEEERDIDRRETEEILTDEILTDEILYFQKSCSRLNSFCQTMSSTVN